MNKKLISEIQIVPVKPDKGLIAFCSFILFESIYCGSVAIFTRPNGGYRLLYPNKRVGEKSIDILHPISKEVGFLIEKEVVSELENVMNNDRYSSTNNSAEGL